MTEKLTQYKNRLAPAPQAKDRVWAKIEGGAADSKPGLIHHQWLSKGLVMVGMLGFVLLPLGVDFIQTGRDSAGIPNPEVGTYEGAAAPDIMRGTSLQEYGIKDNRNQDSGERMQQRQAEYVFEASNPSEIKRQIEDIVNQNNGYIVSTNLRTSEMQVAKMQFKVPVERFNQVINAILDLEVEIEYENVSITDLQADFAQQQSNQAEVEQQIAEVERALEGADRQQRQSLQKRLVKLRSELEEIKNRTAQITSQADFSDLDLTIEQSVSRPIVDIDDWIDIYGIGYIFRTTVSFWAKVLAWIALPAIFYVVYRRLSKIAK